MEPGGVLMGVMALINLPVIVILARPALEALKDYTRQRKAGEPGVPCGQISVCREKQNFGRDKRGRICALFFG